MKKISIIFIIFIIDRLSKIYLINLQETGTDVDFYIFPFLDFYLVWNRGIGFGIMSLDATVMYHSITAIIGFINLAILYMVFVSKNIRAYMFAMVLGGSLGNFFDRIYYYAVPDFIDFHSGNFNWFIFNVADIFITVGIIGLIIVEIITKEEKKLTNV